MTKKRHTYTVKVEYREGAWEIALIPRNGKRMLFCQLYRSESTAEFVADKLRGARIK